MFLVTIKPKPFLNSESLRDAMNENVRKDIIEVLHDVVSCLENNNIIEIRNLSDHIIHSASIFQDEYSITTAVIVFALHKIIQRKGFVDVRLISILRKAITHIQKYQLNKYSKDIKKLITQISKEDSQLNLYIQHVMNEANVKKASKMYEHGISIGQTAELLRISQWELMKYIGNTTISDSFADEKGLRKRISLAFNLFGVER